jgi:hypothetical protein
MEVGQGPNWGCSAKEKKILRSKQRQNSSLRWFQYITYSGGAEICQNGNKRWLYVESDGPTPNKYTIKIKIRCKFLSKYI